MTIAEKIRYLREKKSLTQTELAKKAGIHPVSVRKYETNKMVPTIPQIYKLAKALKVNPDTLLDGEALRVEYKTVGDVAYLIKVLDDVIGLKIEGERDDMGILIPETIKIVLLNDSINEAVSFWEVTRHQLYSKAVSASGRDFTIAESLDFEIMQKHKEITELNIALLEEELVTCGNDTKDSSN